MSLYYLDFEKPIEELDKQILELETLSKSHKNKSDLKKLKKKRDSGINRINSRLTRWQRVQLARHPQRPLSFDYISNWSPDFIELHGDRYYGDDHAIITGIGSIEGRSVAYLAQQKGRNTKQNLYRNFGMMRPEGYRKALRVMKLAEKFGLPVISLIDTIGAYPGIGAEERGQGEAIARNLLEMSALKTPILSIVIGEGASGGALGIGVCDRMLMLENTWYSVISPEGCASILWRDASKAAEAAEALKVIPSDLVEMGICDKVISEPFGGAHRNPEETIQILKNAILEELAELSAILPEEYLNNRINRYDQMGEIISK